MLISLIISVEVSRSLGILVTLINRHMNGEMIPDRNDKTQFNLKAVKVRIA